MLYSFIFVYFNSSDRRCLNNSKHVALTYFFVRLALFLPNHCKCTELLLHLNSHTRAHTHTRGRISLDERSARPRDLYLTLTRDRHTCLLRDSNSQSQQASGRRPAPWTFRPPEPTCKCERELLLSMCCVQLCIQKCKD